MLNKKLIDNFDVADIFFKQEFLTPNSKQKKTLDLLLRTALSFNYTRAAKILDTKPIEYCAGFLTFLYTDADFVQINKWQAIEAFFKLLELLHKYPAENQSNYPSKAVEVLVYLENNPQNDQLMRALFADINNKQNQPYELFMILDKILSSYRKENFSFYRKYSTHY